MENEIKAVKQDSKYQIGDVIAFRYCPGDNWEYHVGVIISVKYDCRGNTEYITTVTPEEIEESNVSRRMMTRAERLKKLQEFEDIVKTLPNTLEWKIEWADALVKYIIFGKEPDATKKQ